MMRLMLDGKAIMSLIKFSEYSSQISEAMAVDVAEQDETVIIEWTEENWNALTVTERAELEAEAVNGWAMWQIGGLSEVNGSPNIELEIFEAEDFLASLVEDCGECGKEPCVCEDVSEAKPPSLKKLPPHLAKFFDKDGNLTRAAAERLAKGKVKFNIKDVTPKGYGPSEDIQEAKKVMSKKGDYAFGKDTSKDISFVTYKGKVISQGDFDSGSDGWWMNITGKKGQEFFDKPSDVISYFTKKKITEDVTVEFIEEELKFVDDIGESIVTVEAYKARNTMQRRATQKKKDQNKFKDRAVKMKAKIERKKGGNKVKRIKMRKKWVRINKGKIKNAHKVFGGKVKSKFTK